MTNDNPTLPVLEDPDIEVEGSDEFPITQEMINKAGSGQFDSTMFEMWDQGLDRAIFQTEQPMSIPLAHSLLKQWTWLRYKDLDQYNKSRLKKLKEAKEVLHACFPKPVELLFQENENDWEIHRDAYIDVIVEWTRLSNKWEAAWGEIPLTRVDKGIEHATVVDITALLINPNFGLVESIRELAGFDITEEDRASIEARINGVSDE